jgi:hypothetical protein
MPKDDRAGERRPSFTVEDVVDALKSDDEVQRGLCCGEDGRVAADQTTGS